MKTMFLSLIFLAGAVAHADAPHADSVVVMNCDVPLQNAKGTVTASISNTPNESVDFVTIQVADKPAFTVFMQMDKGQFGKQMDAGSISMLVAGDKFAQDKTGVIRDAGLFALNVENNVFKGFLIAKGNVYPLECMKATAAPAPAPAPNPAH